MKRRKFLGLSVLGLIGVKPLVGPVVGVDPAESMKDKTVVALVKSKWKVYTTDEIYVRTVGEWVDIGTPWPSKTASRK